MLLDTTATSAQTLNRVELIITHVPPSNDAPVSFRTAFGTGKARWRSSSIKPEVGRSFGVEIDIDDTVALGTNTEKIVLDSPSLAVEGECVVFRGTIEQMWEDQVGCLRMADNCIALIETAGGFSAGDTVRIKVPIRSVSVTPIGI